MTVTLLTNQGAHHVGIHFIEIVLKIIGSWGSLQ